MVPNARARVGNYIYKTYFSGQTSILLLHSIGFSHLKVFPCARHETGRRFDILKSSQRSFLYQVSKSKTNQLFLTSVSRRLSGWAFLFHALSKIDAAKFPSYQDYIGSPNNTKRKRKRQCVLSNPHHLFPQIREWGTNKGRWWSPERHTEDEGLFGLFY